MAENSDNTPAPDDARRSLGDARRGFGDADGHPGPPADWPPLGMPVVIQGSRRAILDAALELFDLDGFAHTSVHDIAATAQRSVGAVYHHFSGKEAIAAALRTDALAAYARQLYRELIRGHRSGEEAVKRLVGHYLDWVRANPALARFMLTSRAPEAFGDASSARQGRRVLEAVEKWTRRWVTTGQVRALDVAVLDAVVVGPSRAFVCHSLAGFAGVSIDDAEPTLAEAAWRAVRL